MSNSIYIIEVMLLSLFSCYVFATMLYPAILSSAVTEEKTLTLGEYVAKHCNDKEYKNKTDKMSYLLRDYKCYLLEIEFFG